MEIIKSCRQDEMRAAVNTFLGTLKKLAKASYACYVKLDVQAHSALNGLPELRARVTNGKNVYDIVYTYGSSHLGCADTYKLKTLWLDMGGDLGYYNCPAHIYFKLTPRIFTRDRAAQLTLVAMLCRENAKPPEERKQQLYQIPVVVTWQEKAPKIKRATVGEYMQLGVNKQQDTIIFNRLDDAIRVYSPDRAYVFDLDAYL